MSIINNMIRKGKLKEKNITMFAPFQGHSRGKHVRLTPTGFKLRVTRVAFFLKLVMCVFFSVFAATGTSNQKWIREGCNQCQRTSV